MAIIGVGVDIVDNKRFKKIIKKNNLLKEYLPKMKQNIQLNLETS